MGGERERKTTVVLDLGRLSGRDRAADRPGEGGAAAGACGPGAQEQDPAEVFARAEELRPRPKTLISLRLDPDILEFFRAGGPGYQSRMNAVLRAYVEHRRSRD